LFARLVLSEQIAPGRIEMLASYLTVGETFFYRENKSLDALERHVFPDLVRARTNGLKHLRIWSAGCCTGEEPYTVAMMVSECPGFRHWNVTIIGTDINQSFLAKAEAGIYSEWSFRGAPDRIKSGFFRKTGGSTYEILPNIRKMVVFEYLNLVGDEYPTLLTHTNAMNLILCRNVLMYFRPDIIPLVVRKLQRSLLEGGWLVASPVESSLINDPELSAVPFPDAILHWKRAAPAARAEAHRKLPAVPIRPARKARRALEPGTIPRSYTVADAAQRTTAYARACDRFAAAEYDACISILADPASGLTVDPGAHELLARAHANAGRLPEAEAWCDRAIRADKLNPARHHLLATILTERNQLEKAAAALKKAIYIDPSFVVSHFALGNLMLRQGMRKEAGRHFANALTLLGACRSEDVLPESDGLSAGRLSEIVRSLLGERVEA